MRETKTIATGGGHLAVVKTYLTIGEVNNALRAIFKDQTSNDGTTKVPLSAGIERNMQLVLAALVSLDGKTENLEQEVAALKLADYNEIFEAVKDLSEGSF